MTDDRALREQAEWAIREAHQTVCMALSDGFQWPAEPRYHEYHNCTHKHRSIDRLVALVRLEQAETIHDMAIEADHLHLADSPCNTCCMLKKASAECDRLRALVRR
jgi:hypothetical protein